MNAKDTTLDAEALSYHSEPRPGKIGIVPYILAVDGVVVAFAEREIIDGVQQVCFSHTVTTQEAIDLGRQTEFCLLYIFIVEYG